MPTTPPEAEWHTSGEFADQRIYRGHAGIERLWTESEEDIEQLNLSVSDIRAVGDKVLVAGTVRGRGKQSKAGFEQPWWFVVTFRDGPTVRVEAYVDPTPALKAAGLRE